MGSIDDAMREVISAEFAAMRREVRSLLEEFTIRIAPTHTTGDEGGYMSVERCAAMLDVTEETVRSWIKAGQLKAGRLPGGREYRIQRADLDACLYGVQAEGGAPIDNGDAVAKMRENYMKARRRRDEPDES